LRLLLKYREVISLGEVAQRVLRLARSLRLLRERLSDPARTWFLAVALPESLSIPETGRLLASLRAAGTQPGALPVHQALTADGVPIAGAAEALRRLLRLDAALRTAAAPRLERGPQSVGELRAFAESWRDVRSGSTTTSRNP